MMLVRIVKSWTRPDLFRQTSLRQGTWGNLRFTFEPVERCDYLIILNHVPYTLEIEVAPENIWCFIQEPPEPEYRWMRKGFAHYARIFSPDTSLRGRKFIPSHGALPWHVDRDYDQLCTDPFPVKKLDLSWITSNATSLPGHRRRLSFLQRLRDCVDFDLFGRGFNAIADKWDGIAPYRYSIAVENSSVPHYWTEKISDCFLACTMPLYFGAQNLAEYFPSESFVWIDIDDPATPRRISEIIKSNRAEKNREAILEARRRILKQYQLFPLVSELVATSSAHISPARRLILPAVPDFTQYFLQHGPFTRLRHQILRQLWPYPRRK